jgi:AraC-like DNA-binding protein
MSDDHREALLRHLDHLISRGPATRVVFALPGGSPPPGAGMVSGGRLSYVTAGCKRIQSWDGAQVVDHELRSGEAMVMPPYGWTVPAYTSARTFFGVVRHRDFTRFIRHSYDGKDVVRTPQLWFHAARPLGAGPAQALGALTELAYGGPPVAAELLWVFLRFARQELHEAPDGSQSRGRSTWNALCEYVNQHLEEELGRDELAQRFRLHPSYVSLVFSQVGGESFSAYVTRLRLERAAELLRHALPVQEVARRCGFRDSGYFIKVFRRHLGVTPGRYQPPLSSAASAPGPTPPAAGRRAKGLT